MMMSAWMMGDTGSGTIVLLAPILINDQSQLMAPSVLL